jgi:hypothetical protein
MPYASFRLARPRVSPVSQAHAVNPLCKGKGRPIRHDPCERPKARTIHESAAPTADMNVLPGILGTRILRRTVQVRLGFESLRMPGGTPIFTVSRHQFMNYPG